MSDHPTEAAPEAGPGAPGGDTPVTLLQHVEPLVVETVTAEMARLKLEQAPSTPDVIVNYYLLLTTNQSTQSIGQFLPATMSWGLPLIPQATQSLKVWAPLLVNGDLLETDGV